jgi:hypothetical protein
VAGGPIAVAADPWPVGHAARQLTIPASAPANRRATRPRFHCLKVRDVTRVLEIGLAMSRVVMDRREASQDHDNRATPAGRHQL